MARLSPKKNLPDWLVPEGRMNGDPNTWEKFPIMSMVRRAVWTDGIREGRNSAISQVWHGLCKVSGMKRKASAEFEYHDPRRPPMFANDTSRNLAAAAISLGVSAILFAYAIIPASPSLVA
jgi:hypothetical protein